MNPSAVDVNEKTQAPKRDFFYFFVKKDQRTFMKNIKLISSEDFITKHKPLIRDFKIRKVKDTKRKFVSRKKLWK